MANPATAAVQSTTTLPGGSSISTANFTSEEAVTSKATYSSKLGIAKGKQENAGVSGHHQRQPPAQKAWVFGTNPLTQRAQILRNGAPSQLFYIGGSSPLPRERLTVQVPLDSGAQFIGTSASAFGSSYYSKMVTQKKLPGSADMPNGISRTNRDQSNMSFQKKDIADVHVTGANLPNRPQNGNSSVFRTDGAISGNRFQGERTLKRWVPDESIETDMSLEPKGTKGGAGWDQFAVNERLFGLTTDYDETIYTTAIDKSHPDYNKRYAEADKKAREIEGSVANNYHVAEERIKDNLNIDDSGLDEEDRYSGVQRQDFPPLASSGRSDIYTPPARRAPAAHATVSGAPVDPAIISSQLARPDKPATENSKPPPATKTTKPEATASQSTNESSLAPTPEPKLTSANLSNSASRNSSPQTRPAGTPNATATVERDVVSAFKGFAAQQRLNADKIRSNKAKADKEVKLHELKKFAASFKLNSPVPSDLVSIIAKDPAKQREIQEKARINAEKAEKEKSSITETAPTGSLVADARPAQRPPPAHGPVSISSTPSRQTPSRTSGFPPQGSYNSQPFRGERAMQSQPIPTQQNRPPATLSARLRSIEQSKNGQMIAPTPSLENRQPPTGPANSGEPSFSRRSSGAINMMAAKLNPNSHEFRPSPFAASFNPTGNPSTGSSPRSNSITTPNQAVPPPSASLIRRKPVSSSVKPSIQDKFNNIDLAIIVQPPPGRNWKDNGGIKPAYDTIPTWRQMQDDEPSESTMHQTYSKLFENAPYPNQTMSPPQPSHVHPQVPHQHQLPFHLQQGAHNLAQRQSPRQPPMHLHNSQHNHGPTGGFNGPDDHRMMPSHSAQSYASPRLPQVNMAYPSPMGQSPQLTFNQPGMQYPIGPGGHQMAPYRSYSGGHQFIPPQATHMGGPVMIQAPAGNGFMGPGMVSPAQQMMYPVAQGHFVPQGNGPPPAMAGTNGYPSPGRSAPMMMTPGSHPGQPVYGMSPGMQFGQPMYAQPQPGQLPGNMQRYPSQGQQQFGTSPQMHQYNQPHRGTPSGSYNKGYQQQHGPHPPVQQHQNPTGPQSRPPDGGEEAK